MNHFNIVTYGGAKCDGVTDDTAAVTKTITDAQTNLYSGASIGSVIFPPAAGICLVDSITFPQPPTHLEQGGWMRYELENGISAQTVTIGALSALIGKSSNLYGQGAAFMVGPCASINERSGGSSPFVTISGNQIYLEGLIVHGDVALNNCAYVEFNHCNFETITITGGFGFRFSNCRIGQLRIIDAGMVTVNGAYLGSLFIQAQNSPLVGKIRIHNVLSEDLTGPFCEVFSGTVGVIGLELDGVEIADATEPYYAIRQIGARLEVTLRNLSYVAKNWIAPDSTPGSINLLGDFYGAGATIAGAKPALAFYDIADTRGPRYISQLQAGQ